ncbi:MAG: Trk system potassium transporter TrkA [Candidatus Hydrogenedentes bacterium]|nr:Trk system potassium transporter TrkA [Candidatus Hydrogenedentota bacterium]
MNIFIVGAGRVGFHLARLLSNENQDVTVLDSNTSQLELVDNMLNVRTVPGNAASITLLSEAGAGGADLFVAASGSDEINLIAAASAKGLGAKQVVARVEDPTYIEATILYEATLGIDYLLSPVALTALEIINYIESPGMIAMEEFGRGLVQMRQMRVRKSSATEGKTVKDLALPPGVLLGVITRNGATVVPHGDTIIEPGDLVTVFGKRDQMVQAQKLFREVEPGPQTVVIMGGGGIGLHLSQVLEHRQPSVKLFEWQPVRCQELAGKLTKTMVVCRDATSRSDLEEEAVGNAHVFVATTSDDERNIMASILAKETGVDRTITVVHQPDFVPLATKLGIDHAVTPRACIANRVLKLVHQKTVSSLAVLEEGQIEIIEFKVDADASVVGKPLKEARLPRGTLVATILRGNDVIVPRGDDVIQAGDSVILIASVPSFDSVRRLFQQ